LNEHWIDAPLIHEEIAMPGQGSAGNVIAAVCSFFIPGLGQLVQGRLLMAAVHFVLATLFWILLLGWIIHLWSILDAALFKPRAA
jgi:TM2 domain-containing membrane protein YozV